MTRRTGSRKSRNKTKPSTIQSTQQPSVVPSNIVGRALSAAEIVFGITELAEAILHHVGWSQTHDVDLNLREIFSFDICDLIRCRRVNRAIYDTIQSSKPLLQNLHLIPVARDSFGFKRHLSPHPRHIEIGPTCDWKLGRWSVYGRMSVFSVTRATGTDALWQNMQVTQPPTTCLDIKTDFDCDSSDMSERLDIKGFTVCNHHAPWGSPMLTSKMSNTNGITFANLMDFASTHLKMLPMKPRDDESLTFWLK